MERIIKNRMSHFLESKNLININQAGFRANHSTEDQVLRIVQDISDGFEAKLMQRTVMCLIDFSRAYYTIYKHRLREKLVELGLPLCLRRWLWSFINERYGQTKFGNAVSKMTKFHDGLVQGGVLSPLLFLCFINDISTRIQHSEISIFADDVAIWGKDKDIFNAQKKLQQDLSQLRNGQERQK